MDALTYNFIFLKFVHKFMHFLSNNLEPINNCVSLYKLTQYYLVYKHNLYY